MTPGAIGYSLGAVSILWGLATFWVFRHFTDRLALRRIGKRIYGHLLGIRLFSEEPALVWHAQKALIADNLRFLRLLALPVGILALPFAVSYSQFEAIYGFRPLETGHSSVVTLHGSDAVASLEVPRGIAVETPPVRDFAKHEVSWRIRPSTSVRGDLRVILPGTIVTRTIAAGERTLSPNRLREGSGQVWIEVDYPEADVGIAGLSLPWFAWFLAISAASAIAFTFWKPARAGRPQTSCPIRSS